MAEEPLFTDHDHAQQRVGHGDEDQVSAARSARGLVAAREGRSRLEQIERLVGEFATEDVKNKGGQ